jgi:TPR repeat protein
MSTAPACQDTAATLQYVQFNASGFADAGEGRTAFVSRALAQPAEVEALLETAREAEMMDELDSVDGKPAHEMYLRQYGVDLHPVVSRLTSLLHRVARTANDQYGCTACTACNVLLRRYRPAERRGIPPHNDRNAFVTAVAQLNPDEFAGGLYLQRTARAASREYFAVPASDVIFHKYDLRHGVDVFEGSRYSAVFWMKDRRLCGSYASPWFLQDAVLGNAHAQEALSELYAKGWHGHAADMRAAIKWGTLAAEQGHAAAQSRLGRLYLMGTEGVPKDAALGRWWVQKAADQGFTEAEYVMGLMSAGAGEWHAAARWFQPAAQAGHAAAQHKYGLLLCNGDGVPMDRESGAEWLERAAEQGHAEAERDLTQLRGMSRIRRHNSNHQEITPTSKIVDAGSIIT